MTIYTSKAGEKKEDDNVDPPVVVTDAWEAPPESKTAKEKEVEAVGGVLPSVVAVSRRRGKHNAANICIVLCAVVVLGLGVLGGIYLYKHLAHRQTFHGWCGVEYYEREQREQEPDPARAQQRGGHHRGREHTRNHHWHRHGSFEEEVELDKGSGNYERIHVPAIEECRSATILHDFSKNYTAIVDNDSHRCFIMNLNRTYVRPPKDFWDLIRKLKSGYYMPKAEVIREHYEVQHPPLFNLEPYGYYIWHDCRWYTTYRLKRRDNKEPVAMVKRAADSALQYSEGNAGTNRLVFVEISGL